MRYIGWFFLFLTSSIFATTEFVTEIQRLEYGNQINDDVLVYLSNGRIVKLPGIDLELIDKLHRGIQDKSLFKIEIDDSRRIESISDALSSPKKNPHSNSLNLTEDYQPSVIGSMTEARNFFYESMPSHKESQCFNRAQVWTHEWRIKHNLYSNKIWLFFTRKYIRQFDFEWWFHVSPYVHVVENDKVRERVMDVKYSRGPVKVKQWTDIFLRDDADCPMVEKYSDQANYPEHGSCFIMKSPMYYYQPVDLEWKEVFGTQKNTWIASEIIEAYREAFDIELQETNL